MLALRTLQHMSSAQTSGVNFGLLARFLGVSRTRRADLGRQRLALVAALVCAVSLAAHASIARAQLSPNNDYGYPTGAYAGSQPKGWVIVIHGGGWSIVGKQAVADTQPWANFFRASGWGTYNIDYRSGARSLTDVLSAYDALRAKVGSAVQVCAAGASAGGQLALLLAAYRPAIACVISEGGPTDFLTYLSEPAFAPFGQSPEAGPEAVMQEDVEPAFGSSSADLWWWSPVRVAARIRARMLLGASTLDELVPQGQMLDMERARPQLTQVMLLPGAVLPTMNFVHASVVPQALVTWELAELHLLAQTIG